MGTAACSPIYLAGAAVCGALAGQQHLRHGHEELWELQVDLQEKVLAAFPH